jgi:hypothetical protein
LQLERSLVPSGTRTVCLQNIFSYLSRVLYNRSDFIVLFVRCIRGRPVVIRSNGLDILADGTSLTLSGISCCAPATTAKQGDAACRRCQDDQQLALTPMSYFDARFLGYVDMQGTNFEDNICATGYGAHLAIPVLRYAVFVRC